MGIYIKPSRIMTAKGGFAIKNSGHAQGSFPMQSDSPLVGATLGLRAEIFGNVATAKVQLIGTATQSTLVSGDLLPLDTISSTYVLGIIVPTEPFIIRIFGTGIDGQTVTWQSPSVINPSTFALQLAPTTTLLTKGQIVPIKLLIHSVTASGNYAVSLRLPPGFLGSEGPWTVSVTPGAAAEVDTSITAPASGQDFSSYVLSAQAFPIAAPNVVQNSQLEFLVE